jgi:hypothetical protein
LGDAANGEYRQRRHLLMDQLNPAQGHDRIIRRDVDQNHISFGHLYPVHQRVGCRHRKIAVRMHYPSYAGTLYQYLQYSSLFVIWCDYYD